MLLWPGEVRRKGEGDFGQIGPALLAGTNNSAQSIKEISSTSYCKGLFVRTALCLKVLFFFGLGEYGPSSLMSQFNTETLENLCEEFRRQEMAVAPTQSQSQSKKTALVATKAKIEKPMSKARVCARIKLETSMPDVKFTNSDASDGEETEDEVNDDVIGQPLANFDTPLEVCNTTYEDNVKTEMVDSKTPIKGILRPRSDSKRKAGLTISKSITY